MDSVGVRGQHGVHLEPAVQGDCAAAGGTHRWAGLMGGVIGK